MKLLTITSLLLGISVLTGNSVAQMDKSTESKQDDERVGSVEVTRLTTNWKTQNKQLANNLIAKYGQPHEATARRLVWWNNGPWKYTELMDEQIEHRFPTEHQDMLLQAVSYRVPTDKIGELAKFDGSIIIDRTRGVMAARCDREEANILALNLAHDIITGKRNAQQARDFYTTAMKQFKDNKISSEYQSYFASLKFDGSMMKTGDPDKMQMPPETK